MPKIPRSAIIETPEFESVVESRGIPQTTRKARNQRNPNAKISQTREIPGNPKNAEISQNPSANTPQDSQIPREIPGNLEIPHNPHEIHKPVLVREVCEIFKDARGIIIDATLGLGGHSLALLESNPNISIIGIDKDSEALAIAKTRLSRFAGRFHTLKAAFSRGVKQSIDECALRGEKIAGILADIGISSYQLDSPKRGFGFHAPTLDMRMDLDAPLCAKDIINIYSREELSAIFARYGEIPHALQMARIITNYRKNHNIVSAAELCALIESNAPNSARKSRIHPATLVFQALRIAVNDELGELEGLLDIIQVRGAKIAIISFHSLEDRMIKERFRLWARQCVCDTDAMKCLCGGNNAKGEILTKKPIIPKADEVSANKRARSAKMRVFKCH